MTLVGREAAFEKWWSENDGFGWQAAKFHCSAAFMAGLECQPVSDTEERRTLAIAQMAAVISSAMHAIDGPWEHRQRIAVDRARDILAEVEKQ